MSGRYTGGMRYGWSNITASISIVAIAFSVSMCAYGFIGAMDESGMPAMAMHHDMSGTQHIDHAHTLTLGTIPATLALLFSLLGVILLWVFERPFLVEFGRFSTARPPPRRRTSCRYLFSPRSPPVV